MRRNNFQKVIIPKFYSSLTHTHGQTGIQNNPQKHTHSAQFCDLHTHTHTHTHETNKQVNTQQTDKQTDIHRPLYKI